MEQETFYDRTDSQWREECLAAYNYPGRDATDPEFLKDMEKGATCTNDGSPTRQWTQPQPAPDEETAPSTSGNNLTLG